MSLYCKYSKEEVLELLALHASKTLEGKTGTIRARFKKDFSVEVEFEEDEDLRVLN